MEDKYKNAVMDWLTSVGLNTWDWPWFGQIALVLGVTLLIAFFLKGILKALLHHTMSTKFHWDDALVGAGTGPLLVYLWVISGHAILGILTEAHILKDFESSFQAFAEIIYLVLLSWFFLRLISESAKILSIEYAEKSSIDPSTVLFFSKILKGITIVIMVLMVFSALGFDISGVLALGGVGGIVIGMAARDSISNLFGGLFIHLEKPFREGDWVRSPDREIEGTVEYVGWRMTRIRTFDQRPLYVPNSAFNTISIENPSRMLNRRIYETIGLRYDDMQQVEAITKAVKSFCQAHPELDMSKTLIVNFNAFNDSSLDFFIYTFTKTTNWVEFHQVKESVLMRIMEIIQNHGADIAFPTRTLHLQSNADETPYS